MPCSWRTSDLQLLLMLTVFLVAENINAGEEGHVTSSTSLQQKDKNNCSSALSVDRKQNHSHPPTEALSVDRKQNHSQPPVEVNTSLPVLVDKKAVLSCSTVPLKNVLLTTWEIILGDKPPCIRAHRRDKHEATKTNCTDRRMTWFYRNEQNILQIDPVVITDDGYYRCQAVTPDGNFHYGYQLRVLVAPEVTLSPSKNRTALCKAAAGKPAAQISWTPEGDCVLEHEYWGNGTVTVQSRCHWAESNVSIVSCSVSHETGNRTQSIELNQGVRTTVFPVSYLLIMLYVKSSVFLVILVMVGIICFQRMNGCR
ncbi:PREDICTED: cell surface glycoprotein CD200 receptor 1 [Miniopterus natalensis]|uniref:cell surface glycoprotein CD200 receptor 1 n=1 Tax=Miniopterus natalensis TaxID=291302 RepID=UPI0007A6F7BA|nr:PREDICTED: cell surface glycoprotein CD200 receptor 1 [Miniopterus natalensis]